VNKNIYKWMIMTFKEIMEDVFKNAIKVILNRFWQMVLNYVLNVILPAKIVMVQIKTNV